MLLSTTQESFTQMAKVAYVQFENMQAKNLFNTLAIPGIIFTTCCFKR